jgi:hypothetical protein
MKGFVSIDCDNSNQAHTRSGGCPIFEGRPNGLFFTGLEASFSPGAIEFNDEIRAAIYATGKQRLTPLMYGIVSMTPSGYDLQTSQEGWGGSQIVGTGELREDYVIDEGGYCLFKQLYKLNGRTMRVFKSDKADNIFGTMKDIEGVDRFYGYKAKVGVTRRVTSDSAGAILLSLIYSTNFPKEDINTHSVPLSGQEIEGLSGIQLLKTAAGKAKIITTCTKTDITSDYGEILQEETIYLDKTGLNPASVTYADGILTFTPAGVYRIANAATLKTAGIEGYEGEEEYIDIA